MRLSNFIKIAKTEPRKFNIFKEGSNWHVESVIDEYPYKKHMYKFSSKKIADLFVKALEGDDDAAKKWYRLLVEYYLKLKYTYQTPKEAWKAAAWVAHHFGFDHDHVNADKDTGEPL